MAQPSEPQLRREAMQRVQIGVVGFCAVLLVVAFANLVVKTARPTSEQDLAAGAAMASNSTAAVSPADTEPLADLGVTPRTDTAQADAPPASVGPSVPDLEPDPRLSRPMDHDPQGRESSAQRR